MHLSDEQGGAIISLITKPSKELYDLKNWWLIAIVKTDYKNGAKCLAFRIKEVLNLLLSEEQTGFLMRRFTGRNNFF